MEYVSGWIVWGIYTWLSWSGEVAEPIGSSVPIGHLLIFDRLGFRKEIFVLLMQNDCHSGDSQPDRASLQCLSSHVLVYRNTGYRVRTED